MYKVASRPHYQLMHKHISHSIHTTTPQPRALLNNAVCIYENNEVYYARSAILWSRASIYIYSGIAYTLSRFLSSSWRGCFIGVWRMWWVTSARVRHIICKCARAQCRWWGWRFETRLDCGATNRTRSISPRCLKKSANSSNGIKGNTWLSQRTHVQNNIISHTHPLSIYTTLLLFFQIQLDGTNADKVLFKLKPALQYIFFEKPSLLFSEMHLKLSLIPHKYPFWQRRANGL